MTSSCEIARKAYPALDSVHQLRRWLRLAPFDFPHGLPKIHEHDGLPAQGFGLIWKGRLVCFYDYQCDLGDGWEDHDVHNDPPELHTAALRMGANLVQYVFGGVEPAGAAGK